MSLVIIKPVAHDIDTVTGSLENIRTAVNAALDRMAKLLTADPSSPIEEENGS